MTITDRSRRILLKLLLGGAVDRIVEQQLTKRAKLRLINDSSPDDVFIVGFPKSGNTWMQNLMAGLMFGIDMRFAPDSLVQDLVPDVHVAQFYRRHLTPTFFKSHHLPRPEYKRVIYLIRDGRDAMVSYFHFLDAVGETKRDSLTILRDAVGIFPCRWHEHVEAWLSNPYGAQMLVVKYEDLKLDPIKELRRICEFADLRREATMLGQVSAQSSFGEMRKREENFGWDDQGVWPADKRFVRRGTIGAFKDEMPAEVLDLFLRQSAQTLHRVGYEITFP